MVYATQRLSNTRYITETNCSINLDNEHVSRQFLGNGQVNSYCRYNEQTELLKSATTLANAELKTKYNPWTRCSRTSPGRST
jgi:hypothetical protein